MLTIKINRDLPCYGLYYNWYAATDIRNIAFSGWHVPTNNELIILTNYVNPGGAFKLRIGGTDYWVNNTGTNVFKFNAIGAGYRTSDGVFEGLKTEYDFWSTTLINATHPYHAAINYQFINFGIEDAQFHTIKSGLSIRLIKDSTILAHGQTGTCRGNNNQLYRTICIGTQEWLADNLVETKYRNGDDIPEVTDTTTWAALNSGALCAYNNDWSYVLQRTTIDN